MPAANSIPQLNLPLRVGIAFIPENYGSGVAQRASRPRDGRRSSSAFASALPTASS